MRARTISLQSIVLGLAAVLCSIPASAQTAADGPYVAVDGLKKISAHVQVIPDDSRPLVPNVGFIVGEKGILIVDTGLGAQNGRAIAAVAQRLGAGLQQYLVTTHVHPEHDLGAGGFSTATKMIRSNDQRKAIAESGLQLAEAFRKMSPVNAKLLEGAAFRNADITFEQSYDLDLGGLTVRLVNMGPNHTLGDTVIWVAPDEVLFAGDLAMQRGPNFDAKYGKVSHWLATLDKLDAFAPKIVVPSHGPIGDIGLIAGYHRLMIDVRDRAVAEKRAGHSLDQATANLSPAIVAKYPNAGRGLPSIVRAAYAEAP